MSVWIIHIADADKTKLSCLVRAGGVNKIFYTLTHSFTENRRTLYSGVRPGLHITRPARDGDCGNPAEPAGIPRVWKLMSRDSRGDGKTAQNFRGNVALFDFYGAAAATKNYFQTVD